MAKNGLTARGVVTEVGEVRIDERERNGEKVKEESQFVCIAAGSLMVKSYGPPTDVEEGDWVEVAVDVYPSGKGVGFRRKSSCVRVEVK